jgi:hypothetical protein
VSRTATSGVVFGIYLVLLGAAVAIVPNLVLFIVGMPAPREVWIRVAGFLAGAIGYYYLRAASLDDRPFFRWTVHARLCVPPAFGAFVALGLAPWQLLLFAAPDLAGAIWTALALRADTVSQ